MVLLGMALGPVFASCSPTYALVLATVLPANFAVHQCPGIANEGNESVEPRH